ncbi:hypothetical protein [Limnoraphis robusta]|uniref:hypothetical protein n=1 Tax=Limnoraphis robusta TaxID=1118279 RepID=UPI001364E21D|nr:hypothetical protein [Limnoraphis robusta]
MQNSKNKTLRLYCAELNLQLGLNPFIAEYPTLVVILALKSVEKILLAIAYYPQTKRT